MRIAVAPRRFTILWVINGSQHLSPNVFDSVEDAKELAYKLSTEKNLKWYVYELKPVEREGAACVSQ